MSSVSSEIQRAINEAIKNQILDQIQATLRSGQGQMTERRWKIPAIRPGFSSEEALDRRFRSSSRDECNRNFKGKEDLNNTCDNLITKRFEYQPESFNLKFVFPGDHFRIEIQTLFTLFPYVVTHF